MKTYRIVLLALAVAGICVTSCDELLSDLLKFNTQWYEVDFTVNPGQIGDVTFSTREMTINVDSVLVANGITRDHISSIRISDARISILTPGQKFDPLDKLEVTLTSDAMEPALVAWTDIIPAGDTVLDLELNKDDLEDYLLQSKINVIATGTLNSKVSEVTDMKAELRWIIRGKITEE